MARRDCGFIEDALSEMDTEKLPEKIARAEVAVCRRIKAKPETKADGALLMTRSAL